MVIKKEAEQNQGHMFVENKILIVEFLGAFVLTYIGCWATIYKDIDIISTTGMALCQALALLVFTRFAISISGAHFNPAITLGLVISKKIDWTSATFYIMAQLLGAIVGAGFIFIQLNPIIAARIKDMSILGIPRPGSNDYEVSAFWGEILGSFFLMYAFLALVVDSKTHNKESIGAASIAFVTFFCQMTLGEISGSGLNPARSLAPAIISGKFKALQFVHFMGPIIGCLLSSVIFNSVYVDDEEDSRDHALKDNMGDEKEQMIRLNNEKSDNLVELKEYK
jgi:aquaporin NIP